jgi:hypothetical protein
MLVKTEAFLSRTPLTLSTILVLVLALVFGLPTLLMSRYTIAPLNSNSDRDDKVAILLDRLTGETYTLYYLDQSPYLSWTVIPRD